MLPYSLFQASLCDVVQVRSVQLHLYVQHIFYLLFISYLLLLKDSKGIGILQVNKFYSKQIFLNYFSD